MFRYNVLYPPYTFTSYCGETLCTNGTNRHQLIAYQHCHNERGLWINRKSADITSKRTNRKRSLQGYETIHAQGVYAKDIFFEVHLYQNFRGACLILIAFFGSLLSGLSLSLLLSFFLPVPALSLPLHVFLSVWFCPLSLLPSVYLSIWFPPFSSLFFSPSVFAPHRPSHIPLSLTLLNGKLRCYNLARPRSHFLQSFQSCHAFYILHRSQKHCIP